ncbi:MAG: alpha/beta fold hydrolase [Crocinitomicaceae bacterium]
MMSNKINFEIINPQIHDKPPIVFLHEGLGCIQSWKSYPKTLCNRLTLKGIVYDRAGYGLSEGDLSKRKNDYLLEAANELYAFLKKMKINKVILYGHSDGGSIALAFAANYPTQVFCVISEAAHVLNETETVDGIKKALSAFTLGKMKGLSKWHGNNYKNVFNAWAYTWLNPNFDLISLKKLLSKIIANQLIIQGKNDQYGTIKQVKTIQSLTHGESTILIPNCAHAPFLEAETEVLETVIKFITLEIDGNT